MRAPIDPADQYQIGDCVLYLPEGVITEVTGYLWEESVGEAPRIIAYELSCGTRVSRESLVSLERYGTVRQWVDLGTKNICGND